MEKFTPGPWSVMRAAEPENTTEFYFTSSKGVIGYWKGGRHHHSDDQWLLTEADANLIAAAPDLLEALEAILPLAEDYDDCGPCGEGWQSDDLMNKLAAARAAIAKAKGEA